MSRKFAVLGYPIGHSMSPLLHNGIFRLKNLPYTYEAVLMPPEKLTGEFPSLKEKYSGFNCTIPLKEKVIPLLDNISSHSKELGSVNTVKCENGKAFGFSTDTEGFLRSLKRHGVSLNEKKVLILGGGGVARVIAMACCREGADVCLALRSPEKGISLKKEIFSIFKKEIEITHINSIMGHYDLLVQCTPVGMYPNSGDCPVEDSVIKNADVVFDTIYNPYETSLIKKAKAFGKTAVGGLEMLVYQGLASQEIWLKLSFTEAEADHLISLLKEKLLEDK